MRFAYLMMHTVHDIVTTSVAFLTKEYASMGVPYFVASFIKAVSSPCSKSQMNVPVTHY